jgi:diguanylate cyclase (GGDEF)-like protein
VVDQSPTPSAAVQGALAGLGYEITGAGDAESALQRVRGDWFDLIIADAVLPDATGIELAQRIRRDSHNRDVPIVLTAASSTPRHRAACLDGGADDFIESGIDVDEFRARVRMHLRRAARHEELVLRNQQDGLTGLWNRAAIEEELRRALRFDFCSGVPTSVLMIDIDGFKAINDTFGHAAGDLALRTVSGRLLRSLRDTDRVGRYGGDEFLVVLPSTDRPATEHLVTRLRRRWISGTEAKAATPFAVDISIGNATAVRGDTADALVRRSDHAMYADKVRSRRTPARLRAH